MMEQELLAAVQTDRERFTMSVVRQAWLSVEQTIERMLQALEDGDVTRSEVREEVETVMVINQLTDRDIAA